MTHCNMHPTSPHAEVTEFPPQRAELLPGQGNFEIGGNGSGEMYRAKKSNTFRGGLSWPDKGSVFASRPSVQLDSFASSLRKYPNMSPERSSEILERLVSYAHNRSGIKTKSSPTRTVESDSQNISLESRRKPTREPEINLRCKRNESPRRDESWRKNTFSKTHDIRCLREITKAVREGIRSHNSPERLIPKRELTPDRRTNTKTRNSVNMEIQAAVQMVSREVITLPSRKPSQKAIAISQTPVKSDDCEGNQEHTKHNTKPFYDTNRIKRSLSDEEVNRRDDFHRRNYKFKHFKPNLSNVFYTEMTEAVDENLAEIIDDWLSIIPLKPIDYFGRAIDREYVFYDLFEKLKKTANEMPEHNRREKIKNDIIELLNEYPVDFNGNKHVFFSKLADILIDRIKTIRRSVKSNFMGDFPMKRYIPPTESELRSFLVVEVEAFVKKAGLMLGRYTLVALEEELLELMVAFMENLHTSDVESFKQDVIMTLIDHGFLRHQASRFAQVLQKRLKDVFVADKTSHLIVFPSIVSRNKTTNPLEEYTKQLCEQINEWLTSIEDILPRINERGFRQVVVNDLAGDIIDRHKYLQMNPSSSENELEYLKYQIFKWINKLAGEDTLKPSDHAPDLMRRIQNIPIFGQIHTNQTNQSLCPDDSCRMKTIDAFSNVQDTSVKTASIDTTNVANSLISKIDRINNEYEEFVKDWVKKIPIHTSTPEEAALAEKARLGINNGLWKAITKLKCDPSVIGNRFYLEDLLDDEIEELLNCLPQTQELLSKKNILKLELINKTTETIERIRAENAKNYRRNLQQNVNSCLQEAGLSVRLDSTEKAREELEIMRIVELFILHTKFRDDDVLKSEVYRKRLLQQAKELIDDLKKTNRGQANINYAVIVSNIVNSLQQVPIPEDNTLNEELENILLESEVQRWFNDLPIYRENNPVENLQWKKQTDILARRIGEIRNTVSPDIRENALRNLISDFIDKTPIHREEMFNKEFMVDELINRLKRIDQSTLDDPGDFNQFCRAVPPSSSYDRFLRFENDLNNESVSYDAFANRKPLSSSAQDDSYKEFEAARPRSSSLRETTRNPQINIQPGTPECCKGKEDKKSPEVGRQRNYQSSSRGIVFKEDNASQAIKDPNDNLVCQTIYAKVPNFEVGDVQLSQDGRHRTVATNTRKRCANFDEVQYASKDLNSLSNTKLIDEPVVSEKVIIPPFSDANPKTTPIVNYLFQRKSYNTSIVNSEKKNSERRKKLLRFIHEIFHNEIKRKLWNEKLLKIIQKLNLPSGEVELEKRMYNLLNESKLTHEEKEFCVNQIIDVMKSLNVPIKKDIQVFHVIPYVDYNLKVLTEKWISKLPLKDEFLDGKLDKNTIQQYTRKVIIKEINQINKINIVDVKENILNALSDIPIDVNFHEKNAFLTDQVNKLIQLIYYPICGPLPNVTNSHVTDKLLLLINEELTDIFDKYTLSDNTHKGVLKLKILKIIKETLSCVNFQKRILRQNIGDLLRAEGKMDARKATNYTQLIVYRLNSVINKYTNTPDWVKIILRACRSEPVLVKGEDPKLESSLTELIMKWLESFQSEMPKLKEEEITTAARDLSNAIQARCRFLQNHPRRVSAKAEIEFLKYLILIWINKMLGRDKVEVLKNANTLLKNILQCRNKVLANSTIVEVKKSLDCNPVLNRQDIISVVNIANTNGHKTQIQSTSQIFETINVDTIDYYRKCISSSIDKQHLYEYMSIRFIYKHYNSIFQTHCENLVKDLSLNENLSTKLTKNILNIVWKVYFSLISDPNTNSNDFDTQFVENFGNLIKSEIIKLNLNDDWTKTLSRHAKIMFDCIYKEQRSCIHRIAYLDVMYRDTGTTANEDRELSLMNLFENLILHFEFKDKDPFKAYIYKEHVKDGLKDIARSEVLYNEVFNILNRVGLDDDSIKYEAQSILTRNEFKDWFKTLPLKCNTNSLLQYKVMTILAKNIHILSTVIDKKSIQREIEKEVISFLQAEMNGALVDLDIIDDTFGVNVKINRKIDRVRFAESCPPSRNSKKSILKNNKSQCYCMKNNCKCHDCIEKDGVRIRGVPNIAVGVQANKISKQTNTEHLIIPGCSRDI